MDYIDIERLRENLYKDSLGAALAGHFGGAFMEAEEIKKASKEKLIQMAKDRGENLNRYAGDY